VVGGEGIKKIFKIGIFVFRVLRAWLKIHVFRGDSAQNGGVSGACVLSDLLNRGWKFTFFAAIQGKRGGGFFRPVGGVRHYDIFGFRVFIFPPSNAAPSSGSPGN